MKFYCGIDLSARDCHVCIIDEQLRYCQLNRRKDVIRQFVRHTPGCAPYLTIIVIAFPPRSSVIAFGCIFALP